MLVKFKLVVVIVSSLVLSACELTATRPDSGATDTYYRIAWQAYQQGDLHVAEGYLHQVTAAEPNHAHSWCLLGHIGFRLNRYDAAHQAYDKCLQIHPQQPMIWHNLAALKLRQATELLITGLPYVSVEANGKYPHFSDNYHLLMSELKRLHGLSGELHEGIVDAY